VPNPPKANPVRRNARVGTVRLPAEGRKGAAPKWPLERQSAAEKQAWTELWHTPQAVAWERLGFTRVVARYCRLMLRAEAPIADKDALAEVRQLEDRLGLTPKAMRLLLWEIVEDEVGEKRSTPGTSKARGARGRIKAVG
jgi:hypothetical protein